MAKIRFLLAPSIHLARVRESTGAFPASDYIYICVCLCVRAVPSPPGRRCLCLPGPFGPAKTSAPSYVRSLLRHLGNILYPALQHYTQFTAKGHYVPVNPLLIDISANSTTSQPHDGSLLPQTQKIAIWRLKTEEGAFCCLVST